MNTQKFKVLKKVVEEVLEKPVELQLTDEERMQAVAKKDIFRLTPDEWLKAIHEQIVSDKPMERNDQGHLICHLALSKDNQNAQPRIQRNKRKIKMREVVFCIVGGERQWLNAGQHDVVGVRCRYRRCLEPSHLVLEDFGVINDRWACHGSGANECQHKPPCIIDHPTANDEESVDHALSLLAEELRDPGALQIERMESLRDELCLLVARKKQLHTEIQ